MVRRVIQLFLSLQLCILPACTLAVGAEPVPPSTSVVINELQLNGAGTKTTDQEFIELHNISDSQIDISGWKLQYITSTGNMATAKYFVTFPSPTVIYPDGFLLITPDTFMLDASPKITYAIASSFAGMAATGGTVELVDSLGVAVDIVGWGTKTTTISETELAVAPPDGSSIQRIVKDGLTVDTNNNKLDFEIIATPTPDVTNTEPEVPVIVPDPEPIPDPAPDTPPAETPPADTTLPSEQNPVEPPQTPPVAEIVPQELPILINELFIDPATPLTDANDEWIELYNPNDVRQDLAGYTVYAGETYAYHHTFSGTASIEPHSFLVITSADTSIALANGGGAVKITGPAGQLFDSTRYEAAKTNQSWAKDTAEQWKWTITPTQNNQNVITVPTVAETVVATAAATAKKTAKTATTTAKTTTAPKATTAKVTKVKAATDSADGPALVAAPTPLPVWLLATLGTLAVLYSGYEYRFDIANKLYQLRNYRTARQNSRRQL